MALPALHKVALYQIVVMFCKPVNPAEGEKDEQVWCAVHLRDALTNHDYALTPATLFFLHLLRPMYNLGESVYAVDFSVGLFHGSSKLVRPTDGV